MRTKEKISINWSLKDGRLHVDVVDLINSLRILRYDELADDFEKKTKEMQKKFKSNK